jgi:hypothetical protein
MHFVTKIVAKIPPWTAYQAESSSKTWNWLIVTRDNEVCGVHARPTTGRNKVKHNDVRNIRNIRDAACEIIDRKFFGGVVGNISLSTIMENEQVEVEATETQRY